MIVLRDQMLGSVAEWFKAAVLKTAASPFEGCVKPLENKPFFKSFHSDRLGYGDARINALPAYVGTTRRHTLRHNLFRYCSRLKSPHPSPPIAVSGRAG